ncbi:SagB family peptide dehydrogenase [Phytoactinopolyspora halotolerans]|nr:SagB family peptide dehydrogenase [Phytoactinopolyspora halotolerans]
MHQLHDHDQNRDQDHHHHHHHHHDLVDVLPAADPTPPADAQTALDYARRMFERQRVPLPPFGFTVDWADQPSKHKLYLDAPRLPLPAPFADLPPTDMNSAARRAAAPPGDTMPDLATLAAALGCYSLTGRRTEPNWNEDSSRKLASQSAVWSRPTPSGGGMYPAESYLVVGDDGPLPAGLYHYATAQHSLDRLAVGSRCAELTRATGVAAQLYLVGSLRFWKNAFKYNSFSYHVVTQDMGALLGSWRLVLAAHGLAVEPLLWFDEDLVSGAIEVDGQTEAPFVVLPLGAHRPVTDDETDGETDHKAVDETGDEPSTRLLPLSRGEPHRVWERSARVRTFPLVEEVHAAALVGDEPRPEPGVASAGAIAPAEGEEISLPPGTDPADLDLAASLQRRHSSFGLLSAQPPLSVADLGWVLSVTARIGAGGTDVAPAGPHGRSHPWTRLWVLANQVDGLEQRGYAYDADSHRLIAGAPVDFAELQRYYALTNYSVREAAALVVITGRLRPLVHAYGGRGYRMLSIEVGQNAQALYLAATARRLGVGAVLGVDNLAVDEMLGIDDTDENSMLFALIGHERGPRAGYDHTIRRPEGSRQR